MEVNKLILTQIEKSGSVDQAIKDVVQQADSILTGKATPIYKKTNAEEIKLLQKVVFGLRAMKLK